jgi:hypothetical protein
MWAQGARRRSSSCRLQDHSRHLSVGHPDQRCQSPTWGPEELVRHPRAARGSPTPRGGEANPTSAKGDRERREAERVERPHVREPQVPGSGACPPGRTRARVYTRTREGGGTGREGARRQLGRRAPRHTQLTPAPTPTPTARTPPGLDGPVTFLLSPHLFLLVAGVHIAVGVAGFKLQVPQAHGQTGCVWSGRGKKGHSGGKK